MTPARIRALRHLLALAALAGYDTPAFAVGASATATGQALAEVMQPIAITPLADLDFGVIVSSPGMAGSVIVAAGQPSAQYSGGAQAGCEATLGCPLPHAAKFAVTGEPGRNYAIAAPTSIRITGEPTSAQSGPPPALTISAITLNSANRPGQGASGQFDANGADAFTLGGTLEVPASLPPARYRVSLQVVTTYN